MRPSPGALGSSNGTRHQPALALEQVDALTRQQQRILHSNALIAYVLAAEKQGGQTLTMGDALGELVADTTEAARTIGMILQCLAKKSKWAQDTPFRSLQRGCLHPENR